MNKTSNKTPVLWLENTFLFPNCEIFININGSNKQNSEVIKKSLISFEKKIIIITKITNKDKNFLKNKKIFATLGRINLNSNEEAFLKNENDGINRIGKILIIGEKKIIVNNEDFSKDGEIEFVEKYEILRLEKEDSENIIRFINLLPELLREAKISLEKTNNLNLKVRKIEENFRTILNFIVQNSSSMHPLIKYSIFSADNFKLELNYLEIFLLQRKKEELKKEKNEDFFKKKRIGIITKLKEENDEDVIRYLSILEKEKLPKNVSLVIENEIKKLRDSAPNSAEFGVIKNYIENVISFPWNKIDQENEDISSARNILEENHYGLEEAKELILEFFASRKRSKELRGIIIFFVGPPGVGKTTFASSIARAMGRKFATFSLAGVSDESEIKGHRITYVGSKPGRITEAIKRAESLSCLLLIDEIDKTIKSRGGDPVNALLDIFDPSKQNFIDSFLGDNLPIDTSNMIIICTANSKEIPEPLLDRMEIIELQPYTLLEKEKIASKHIIPKMNEKYNTKINFLNGAIKLIIEKYTSEAGVRELKRKIEKIFRKIIINEKEKKYNEKIIIENYLDENNIKNFLKDENYVIKIRDNPLPGIVNGLAWTKDGGCTMAIEASVYEGKTGVKITGNFGKIMTETVSIALGYIEANCEKFGIKKEDFAKNIIHINALEAAIPKEGPSAGITLATAIISSLTKIPVSNKIGMTGEITLHGRVTAIGGLIQKTIAAQRNGLTTIIFPKANEKDWEKMPLEIKESIKVHMVEDYEEVWRIIFPKEKKNF